MYIYICDAALFKFLDAIHVVTATHSMLFLTITHSNVFVALHGDNVLCNCLYIPNPIV
jgi:hypothetical protein